MPPKTKIGRYLYNLFIGIDQLLNAIEGGDPLETVSSRLGRLKTRHGGQIPWSRPVARITDAILDRIEPGHSLHAIRHNVGSAGLVDIPETGDTPCPPTPPTPPKPTP